MRAYLLAATALTSSAMFLIPGGAVAQTQFDWSGFYVGGSAGVILSDAPVNFDYDSGTSGPDALDLHARGGLAGLTAGYNVQMDQVVFGVEADGSFSSLAGSTSSGLDEAEARLNSLLTLRARLGLATGRALFYGTVGVATGHVDYSATIVDSFFSPDPAEASGMATGVIAGAGVEFALTDSVSLKTEGLMYRLSSVSGVGDTGKGGFTSEYAPSGAAIRTGINAHF